METDSREVVLSHLQHIVAVGHKHVATLTVNSHELVFALLECLKSLGIIALYPACLEHRKGLPTHRGAILVKQTVLNYLKLKLSHRSHDLTSIELIDKQLGYTFVHELL